MIISLTDASFCDSATLRHMERVKFQSLVRLAVERIPDIFRSRLDNVDVVVEDKHAREELGGHVLDEDANLLGLYEGLPLTERDDYGMVLPDKITLYQEAIESLCYSDEEIIKEIQNTLIHEVAHHFGIDDERLDEIGV